VICADYDEIRQIFAGNAAPIAVLRVSVQPNELYGVGHPVFDESAVVDIEELAISFGILFVHV
jgi:hypothetical protein